jgi:hypothetical protein
VIFLAVEILATAERRPGALARVPQEKLDYLLNIIETTDPKIIPTAAEAAAFLAFP